MPSLQTGWRALVPLVVGGSVALGVAVPLTAGASAPPARTAGELLRSLDSVAVAGYSGTVVQKSTLLDRSRPAPAGLSLSTLMAGSNTIKVWSAGADRQRIAVLDATGESDLYRNGADLWQWDSNTQQATYQTISVGDSLRAVPIPVDGTTVTPDDLARAAVAAVGPSTAVQVASPSTVAGRAVYRVTLTPPASTSTRIGRIVLSLDGENQMPLAAQVYARGEDTDPSIDLAFTHIAFRAPDAATFSFTPPAGAQVSTFDSADPDLSASSNPLLGLLSTTTHGDGWTRVAVISPPNADASSQAATTAQFGSELRSVSGSWGHGKLLDTPLLTMLFVSDGRIVVGAVEPAQLYAAL